MIILCKMLKFKNIKKKQNIKNQNINKQNIKKSQIKVEDQEEEFEDKEETIINNLIQSMNKNMNIIIYGRNCNDEKIYLKHKQLLSLGFYNVYVYVGGLFEWLLLQDIYGDIEFPTTEKELDILKYKSNQILNIPLIEY